MGADIIMVVTLLLVFLTFSTGVCSLRPQQLYVKAGEMVALHCPHYALDDGDAKLLWTSPTIQEMDLPSHMLTSAEQRQMGVLLHQSSLVILRASVNHQGNYSCSLGNTSSQFWFELTVVTTPSREYEEGTQYPSTCHTQKSCSLSCPDNNVPYINTVNFTSNDIVWHKDGEPSPAYFSSVEQKDSGVYDCTRSYLYHGQTYHMTFTVVLDVKPSKKSGQSVILSPQNDDVFPVDLNSTVVIGCEAVLYSKFDEVFWLSGRSFVEKNSSRPVYYNYTRENETEGNKVTASLVIRKVSEEDLSKIYICKLESDHQSSRLVSVTLTQKARPFSVSLALCIVGVLVAIVVTVVVYAKLKIDIALFLRDALGCYRRNSDGKSYDAYLMFYKSDTDAGLSEDDRKWMTNILEERFGYSLCLYDRDASAGKAAAQAVLDCVEQSRTVVLVPTSPDPGLGFDLLNDIHAALVERQTHLVFIKTETKDVSSTSLLPEALQLLSKAGDCVTWKGKSSMLPSSSFCKQLRYYLPAPQHTPRPLPQTATRDDIGYNI